ncbi:hypothetical protein OGAPHI_000586 [Ogataea philodendri]|uniref:Uncharacterized protein n=1 Tax=Ogataea philodendri TaxID=1378263 RepID=A0A9P8PFW1_9ASCO|nr:uncharacterized protein OGAPHI_000586 [Ogataea philodendri]KAH3670875.1 hypothetical protein OGAPHI_000586 [Ogataea philodendri]
MAASTNIPMITPTSPATNGKWRWIGPFDESSQLGSIARSTNTIPADPSIDKPLRSNRTSWSFPPWILSIETPEVSSRHVRFAESSIVGIVSSQSIIFCMLPGGRTWSLAKSASFWTEPRSTVKFPSCSDLEVGMMNEPLTIMLPMTSRKVSGFSLKTELEQYLESTSLDSLRSSFSLEKWYSRVFLDSASSVVGSTNMVWLSSGSSIRSESLRKSTSFTEDSKLSPSRYFLGVNTGRASSNMTESYK